MFVNATVFMNRSPYFASARSGDGAALFIGHRFHCLLTIVLTVAALVQYEHESYVREAAQELVNTRYTVLEYEYHLFIFSRERK